MGKFRMIKFFILFLFMIFLFSFPIHSVKEESIVETPDIPVEEKIVIDPTIYKKLTMKSLSVVAPLENAPSISWYYNKNEGIYYLYLPKLFDRRELQIAFDCGVNTYLSIYDAQNQFVTKIVNMEVVSLLDENYTFEFETNVKEKTSYKVKVMQSNLASLYINLDGGDASFSKILGDANHKTGYPGAATLGDLENEISNLKIKNMRGRGNATWQREKKPFQIKLEEKASLLGMKEAKTWLLLTNYPDGTLSRNALWYSLAQKMEMPYPVTYEPIELYINSVYQGQYLLTSKVEENKNRVPLSDGDYLFEIDHHTDADQIKLNHGYPVNIHYPDLDNYSLKEKQEIKNNAKSYLNKVESLIYNPKTTTEELASVIDFTSFAKYYWIQELSLNIDAARNSFYLFTKDGKLYAGPLWDMDATMNRSYTYTKTTGYYVLDDVALANRTNESWFRLLLKRKDFSAVVDQVFYEYLDIFEGLLNDLDSYSEKISESVLMNYSRWPYQNMMKRQGQTWRANDKDYSSSLKLLKQDLETRINWYKKQYAPVTYDSYFYKTYNNKDLLTSGEYQLNTTNFISSDTNRVVLYGKRNDKEFLLEEITITEDCVEKNVEFKTKTSSKYKTYNQNFLEVTFCKK